MCSPISIKLTKKNQEVIHQSRQIYSAVRTIQTTDLSALKHYISQFKFRNSHLVTWNVNAMSTDNICYRHVGEEHCLQTVRDFLKCFTLKTHYSGTKRRQLFTIRHNVTSKTPWIFSPVFRTTRLILFRDTFTDILRIIRNSGVRTAWAKCRSFNVITHGNTS